jgi:ribonuclease HI
MKKLMFALMTSTIALTLGGGPLRAADNDDAAKHFRQRADQINAATAKDPDLMQTAIKHISVETGVPVEKVRLHHQRHPNMGAAGLLLANVMAAETKEPPATFLKERQSGDQWLAIAREHKVSVEKLNVRLDNVWKALAPAVKDKS